MKITDLLDVNSIKLRTLVKDKNEIIDLLVDLQNEKGILIDKEKYKAAIVEREKSSSTAIERGIAVPHAKSNAVKAPSLVAATLKDGIDYQAMDKKPSDLFFMIAAPVNGDVHLEILSRLMALLMDDELTEKLKNAVTPQKFMAIIDAAEAAKFTEEVKVNVAITNRIKVLAVTACPTGVAHTYMAAEALEKAGKKLNISVKAETNGSGGVKNALTKEEIENCDAIIIAADKKVETARFNGKKVIFVPVNDGIHRAEELVKKAADGNAPVFKYDGEIKSEDTAKESIGRSIYKNLMNGVSHMLPFVIGGGILIALAFLFDNYAIDPSNFGMNTPVAAFFKTVGGIAFGFMLPILAGYIAYSIADRPGLAVGFVGGAIASSGNSFGNITGVNAVSAGFLGALVAGFAAGYIVLLLKKIFSKMPQSMEGIKPVFLYPLLGIFLIGAVMFVINPFMGVVNTGITDFINSMGGTSKVLLGAVVGGMMSVDMGGPVNKAAYVFGTASLAIGNFDIMAAVMVGGMIPPLVIALSTTFFKNKWTADERKSGLVNYIMGLCFISEGAIPFAAADPLRVIPSCIVGSAVGGALSMLFGCTLRAPHGGIFVFPVVGNVLGYFIALAVGSAVGMIILSFIKRNTITEKDNI